MLMKLGKTKRYLHSNESLFLINHALTKRPKEGFLPISMVYVNGKTHEPVGQFNIQFQFFISDYTQKITLAQERTDD